MGGQDNTWTYATEEEIDKDSIPDDDEGTWAKPT